MSFRSWVTSSLVRHYPSSSAQRSRQLTVEAALNEQFSFQVALRTADMAAQRVRAEMAAPGGWAVRVRRVGYVPIPHFNLPVETDPADVEGAGNIPGYAPDPLFDDESIVLPPNETHAFWITVRPGRSAAPGRHVIAITLAPENGGARSHTVNVTLHDVVIRKRKNFPVTHWFYADALCDWYGVGPFGRAFWPICEKYMKDYASHGLDTIYAPVFTPPLDGVKRPTQLLRVKRAGKDKYRFSWSDVKKWIDLAKRCGIDRFEWTHPFTQWGVKHAIRIYEDQGRGEKLLWPPSTGATSAVHRGFLSQYLPQLHRFLVKEKILHRSFFHVSDEPHAEHLRNYRKARDMLGELAPWMKVMDALSNIEFARAGLTDMPIPSIKTALDFVKEDVACWCYYCCGPKGRFLNRLIDTPLAKIAMHGFLFYRWPLRGFLHWGYNYWYKSQTRTLIDPYAVLDGDCHTDAGGQYRTHGWAYGDTFQVYPGPDGPVDSMRWEVFGESLQDYALFQTLGVDPDCALFEPIKSFADFPKSEAWRLRTRSKLFAGNNQHG